ncbi:MAG: flagellar hook capping FlgD N-terminal domain-containing protein [Pseudomonadota bacterium]
MQAITETSAGAAGATRLQLATEDDQSVPSTTNDFQDFLQLLTAQLRNQDPLSPLDSTQFVAQLASFSTVEQLVNANERLDSIASSLVGDAIERYAPWIGQDAEYTDALVNFDGDPVRYRIPDFAEYSRVELSVTDSVGGEVDRFVVNDPNVDQNWSGAVDGQKAPDGKYLLMANYFDDNGLIHTEPVSVFDTISAVRLNGDAVEIHLLGGGIVSPEQITGLSARDNSVGLEPDVE